MKIAYLSLAAILLGFFGAPAFAIDQVTLKNGKVVEGTVVNDVPNLYVDIRLINGDTKRFQKSEVSDVSRDVPSRKDRDTFGNQTLGFVAVNLGGAYPFQGVNKNVIFDYGIKVGGIVPPASDTKIGFAISYDRSSRAFISSTLGSGIAYFNDINIQMMLMRIANTGFYLGPNVGLEITSGINGTSDFEVGAGIGYEVFLSNSFAVGPDFRYEHIFDSVASADLIKFTIQGSMHF